MQEYILKITEMANEGYSLFPDHLSLMLMIFQNMFLMLFFFSNTKKEDEDTHTRRDTRHTNEE